ncbi:MAG TPA: GNAT family N-acetyltransferase [Gemmatimonadaceae bacterium]|nr:GNAT family N-acetyltransferase [Gemmatimonadaceae bacterium]
MQAHPSFDVPGRQNIIHPESNCLRSRSTSAVISREPIQYREATSADVPAMAQARLTDPTAGTADPRMAAYFDGRHHPQQALLPRVGYVAVANNAVIGYIAGHRTRRLGCDGEVQYLYVTVQYRRQGVATALLRVLAEWFRAQGVARVCVNVDAESPPAPPFYVRCGATPLSPYWYIWPDIGVLLEAPPASAGQPPRAS